METVMSLSQPLTSSQRRSTTAVPLTICDHALWPPPAAAQHRARLSADLADHLAAGSQAINVIVHGDKATVDTLARRYNVTVRKYLSEGGVLRVTAGQLAALRDDADVDHLSGDLRIKSSAAEVTAQSDRRGSGVVRLGVVPALSGRGVTVAVIDSGIDTRHEALARRVIATRDFTGGDGRDLFGHGTHVAALIAGRAGRTADTGSTAASRRARIS
jgi:subtilisin family serine protease